MASVVTGSVAEIKAPKLNAWTAKHTTSSDNSKHWHVYLPTAQHTSAYQLKGVPVFAALWEFNCVCKELHHSLAEEKQAKTLTKAVLPLVSVQLTYFSPLAGRCWSGHQEYLDQTAASRTLRPLICKATPENLRKNLRRNNEMKMMPDRLPVETQPQGRKAKYPQKLKPWSCQCLPECTMRILWNICKPTKTSICWKCTQRTEDPDWGLNPKERSTHSETGIKYNWWQ